MDYQIVSGDNGKVLRINTANEPVRVVLPSPTAGFKVTIKDASGNASVNNILISSSPIYGAEAVTNGTFDTNLTGWSNNNLGSSTNTWESGSARLSRNNAQHGFYQILSVVAGKNYKVTFDVADVTGSGALYFKVQDGSTPSPSGANTIAGVGELYNNKVGTHSVTFTAISASVVLYFHMEVQAVCSCLLDNVSVKEMTDVLIDYSNANTVLNKNMDAISLVSDGTNWFRFDEFKRENIQNSGRALFGGGRDAGGTAQNTIDYVNFSSTANAVDFGDLLATRRSIGACASSIKALWAGNTTEATTIYQNIIATLANSTNFGSLLVGKATLAGCGNSTRGLFGGGTQGGGSASNVVEYVNIPTTGNAIDFGDLTVARDTLSSFSSSTRGIWAGGSVAGTSQNVIDYVTIATAANAIDFGDLTLARQLPAACSSSTRGVIAGGFTGSARNSIDYVTIATTGNAATFSTLTTSRYDHTACSSNTVGLFAGGDNGSTVISSIESVYMPTLSYTSNFANLSQARKSLAAASSCHGGLYV